MLTVLQPKADKGLTVQVDGTEMDVTSLIIYKEGPWCSFVSDGVQYYTNKSVTIVGGKAQVDSTKPVRL